MHKFRMRKRVPRVAFYHRVRQPVCPLRGPVNHVRPRCYTRAGEDMPGLMKRIIAGWLFAAVACAAETPADIRDAVDRMEQKAANAPAGLAVEFRVKAAYVLHGSWPNLSRELTARSVTRLRSGTGWRITPDVMQALATLDPDGAMSVLPRIQANYAENVIDGLARLHRIGDALSIYQAALARGARVTAALSLFGQLSYEKSPEISKLYRAMLTGFSFDALAPEDALWIDSQLTKSVAEIDPAAAVEGTLRILKAASHPEYAKGPGGDVTGDFEIGSRLVTTSNGRDTVLLVSGARLFVLAPAEFEKRKALFARWGAAGPILVKSTRWPHHYSPNAKTVFVTGRNPAQVMAVADRISKLDDQASADDNDVISLAAELRRLPPGWGKLNAARDLAKIALYRQAGVPAVTSAASALLEAIRDSHPALNPGRVATSFSEDYLTVAELIRYANARLAVPSPAIEAAEALLTLRERVWEHTGFAVEDLEGKPTMLSPVPGKVTIISRVSNVCARWRMQCDQPLPALEAFYKEFGNKGVAVFAIAGEGRDLFTDSLNGATSPFTVPVFFDPDDLFGARFEPHGLESFLFDGEGKLVLRVIGIRTQDQLSEMVKKVGVKQGH